MHTRLLFGAIALILLSGVTVPAAGPAMAQLLPWLTQTKPVKPRTAPRRPSTSGGALRTLCVRTCDGYYFPISFKTSRSKLNAENISCLQRCPGGTARLFYHRNPGGSINNAVDLKGKRYRDLENAFRYRKELVAGCSCDDANTVEAQVGGQ